MLSVRVVYLSCLFITNVPSVTATSRLPSVFTANKSGGSVEIVVAANPIWYSTPGLPQSPYG